MQPDHPELRVGDEARRDGAALEARRQPAGIAGVVLGPAGQVLDLPGVGEHAVEPLGFQPVERTLPVVAGCLHHDRRDLPGPKPVRQRQHLPPGRAEAAGLGRPPRRVTVGRHPDRRGHPGLADVDAADPVPVQRLVTHLLHASHPLHCRTASLRGGTARGAGGERKKLTRVLEATMNSPLDDRLPASGCNAASGAVMKLGDLSQARGSAGGAGWSGRR